MITIRYKPLKSGKFSTYLDIINNNKRTYEFLKIHVSNDYSTVRKIAREDIALMEKVEELRSKRHLEVINESYGIVTKKKEDIDFIQYVNKYRLDNSDELAQRLLFHLKAYSNEKLYISELTYDWIVSFKNYLKKVKQNTIRSYLWKLKQLLNHAVRIRLIDEHNFQGIEIPTTPKTERTTLTIEEVKLLSETPVKFNIQIKQAFLFSCFTGLRMGDIMALKHSEIQGDYICLMPKKTRFTSGKTLKLPLTTQAKEILKSIPKTSSEKVFFSLPQKQQIGRAVEVWGLKAKLNKHLHFHAARHTFATIGITYGIDVYTMKELLGHSKIEMTQIYAKIVDEKKNTEVAKFPTI